MFGVFRSFVLILLAATYLSAQTPVAIRRAHVISREAPTSTAKTIATLHQGDVFVIVDDQPYWYGITLRDGRTAYVPKSACTVLPEGEPTEGRGETTPADSSPDATPSTGGTDLPNCTPSSVPANWSICPATGSGGIYAAAYVQKNRLKIPCHYTGMTVQQMLSLPKLSANVRALPAGNQNLKDLQARESQPVVLEGYLALVKDGGQEGTNCKSPTRKDVHMEIVDTDAADPKSNRGQHVITEVTPWFEEAVTTWTKGTIGLYAAYVDGYSGNQLRPPTKIRVYGWLFYDEAHVSDGSIGQWRGTAWEIHPITRIEVFENGVWKVIQ